MRLVVFLLLASGALASCSAPQCDFAKLRLWNDGTRPHPYRASIICYKGKDTQTIHLLRSKTRIQSGCE